MRVVVIGSGIVGASAAYHAAGLGAETVLVDGPLAGEATAAGAGIVCPWVSAHEDPHWFRLAAEGARYYAPLAAELAEAGEPEFGYRRVGALRVSADEAEPALARERALARRQSAADTGELELLAPDRAAELFPPLAPGLHALHIPAAARVDGRLLRAALRRQAERRGARVLTGRAELVRAGDRIAGVTLAGERLAADAVIAAAGAWTADLLAPHGIELPLAPQRGQIVHLGLPGVDTARWPVILPGGTGHYLVPFGDSRVVAGATRETGAGFDHRVTAGGLAEVLVQALAVAPGLAGATHLETRVGFRPAAAGDRPLLGAVPGLAGLVLATGLGATGLTMGPVAGRLAAALAVTGTAPFDLAPYAPLGPASPAPPSPAEPGTARD
ncbi:NAD(P)/FAD-dependent oxidoreductase [Streptomyces hoynatensis]|uniref:FAD-binding oxidoreductase n=1 Tax=Streptomyces hoynatensis TaxID=1141874 RepID=A0A3A9Z5Z9_9ACTN|nr:FAD-dependent oxidoreductase [Streptomyces hoynatensis]RKN43745.1 FAD-binding oxidoreductase [Streptomyces hoynatensis]